MNRAFRDMSLNLRPAVVDRRAFTLGVSTAALGGLIGGAAGCFARATAEQAERPPNTQSAPPPSNDERTDLLLAEAGSALAALERSVGGRLGACALDTGSRRSFGRRADERFALCSTFKWLLAAVVLERADRHELKLDELVTYGEGDLLEYAPVARAHVSEGALTVEELARAAVVVSDNTAANLLLPKIGGPLGLTHFTHQLGDEVTRLDRNEPTLNENAVGDVRDTTSPSSMVRLAERILCGDVLSTGHRALLSEWLRASETGKERIRAGLPSDWIAGDKTGTGARGAVNDVAVICPPKRAPLLVAVYLSDSSASVTELGGVHAEVGRIAARVFA